MITLLNQEALPEFLALAGGYPPAGAPLETACCLYGLAMKNAQLWLGRAGGGEATAALGLLAGTLYIAAGNGTDLDELSAFLAMLGGVSAVEAPLSVCRALFPREKLQAGRVMLCPGAASCQDTEIAPVSPREVYKLVCEVQGWQQRDPAWSEWYVHLSALVRGGYGLLRGIRHGGGLAATAGVYASGASHALIGGVVTAAKHRGKGYASRLVRSLAGEISARGKQAVLLAETGMTGFYRGLGFEESGFQDMGHWKASS